MRSRDEEYTLLYIVRAVRVRHDLWGSFYGGEMVERFKTCICNYCMCRKVNSTGVGHGLENRRMGNHWGSTPLLSAIYNRRTITNG